MGGPGPVTRILVVGDVVDDVLVRPLSPVTVDSDTRSRISRRPGGSAANQASWLGVLGADVTFVGRLAAADRDRHAAALTACGVTPRLVGGGRTGTVMVLLGAAGDRTMFTDRGAGADLDPSDVDMTGMDHLHLTGYSLAPPAPLAALLDLARERGVPFSVDPSSVAFLREIGPDRFLDLTAGALAQFPNEAEARVLTGLDRPEEMAARLAERHRVAVVTLGALGAVVATAGEVSTVPAVPAECVDPTGAGDAFCAGFLHAWLAGASPADAGRAGAAIAARAVATVGARPDQSEPATFAP